LVSAPDAAALHAAVRAEGASAVRDLLADATEANRRALAKELKTLLKGPGQARNFRIAGAGDIAAFNHMVARLVGSQPNPGVRGARRGRRRRPGGC
jgi:hypothetical protein